MKNLNTKKIVLLAVSLVAVFALAVGCTLMFLSDKTQEVKNTFNPSQVTCVVEEDSFDGTTKSGVTVRNTSDIDADIRAAIIINWVDKDGNILGEAVPASAYTLTLGADWTEGSDGYYYYKQSVAPGAETTNLISSCVVTDGAAPEDYYLSVTVLADAIQSVVDQAKTDAGWAM